VLLLLLLRHWGSMLSPNVGVGDGKSLLLLLLLLLMMMMLMMLMMMRHHALLLLLILLLITLMLRWLLRLLLLLLSKVGLWRWGWTSHHPWLLHRLRAACPWSHIGIIILRRCASGPRPCHWALTACHRSTCHWALTACHRSSSSTRQHRACAATVGPVRRWRCKPRGPARVWLRLRAAWVWLRLCAAWVWLRLCAAWVWLRLCAAWVWLRSCAPRVWLRLCAALPWG
jgi:hypothetical protein